MLDGNSNNYTVTGATTFIDTNLFGVSTWLRHFQRTGGSIITSGFDDNAGSQKTFASSPPLNKDQKTGPYYSDFTHRRHSPTCRPSWMAALLRKETDFRRRPKGGGYQRRMKGYSPSPFVTAQRPPCTTPSSGKFFCRVVGTRGGAIKSPTSQLILPARPRRSKHTSTPLLFVPWAHITAPVVAVFVVDYSTTPTPLTLVAVGEKLHLV